jgi:preprotein translocase subunit YajC
MLFLADAAAADGGSALVSLAPLLLIGVFVYFAMIRPQRKRQQEFRRMQSDLSPGDDVITIGGLHGRVDSIGEGYVDLVVTDDMVLRFKRTAIAEILRDAGADDAPELTADDRIDDE